MIIWHSDIIDFQSYYKRRQSVVKIQLAGNSIEIFVAQIFEIICALRKYLKEMKKKTISR